MIDRLINWLSNQNWRGRCPQNTAGSWRATQYRGEWWSVVGGWEGCVIASPYTTVWRPTVYCPFPESGRWQRKYSLAFIQSGNFIGDYLIVLWRNRNNRRIKSRVQNCFVWKVEEFNPDPYGKVASHKTITLNLGNQLIFLAQLKCVEKVEHIENISTKYWEFNQ